MNNTHVETLPRHVLVQLKKHMPHELTDEDLSIIHDVFKNNPCKLMPTIEVISEFQGVYLSWEEFVEYKTMDFLDWCKTATRDAQARQKVQRLVDYFDYRRFEDDLEADFWFIDITDDRVAVFIRDDDPNT